MDVGCRKVGTEKVHAEGWNAAIITLRSIEGYGHCFTARFEDKHYSKWMDIVHLAILAIQLGQAQGMILCSVQ